MKKNIFVLLSAVGISLGVGFYGGFRYAEQSIIIPGSMRVVTDSKTKIPKSAEPFAGTIDSVTNGLIVITTNKGETRGVGVSSLTKVVRMADASMEELVPGTQVFVHGIIEGGVTGTARYIQIEEWLKK